MEFLLARDFPRALPAPDTGLRLAGLAHDLVGADAIGAQQHDLGPPRTRAVAKAVSKR
jgi:hypothetical protein